MLPIRMKERWHVAWGVLAFAGLSWLPFLRLLNGYAQVAPIATFTALVVVGSGMYFLAGVFIADASTTMAARLRVAIAALTSVVAFYTFVRVDAPFIPGMPTGDMANGPVMVGLLAGAAELSFLSLVQRRVQPALLRLFRTIYSDEHHTCACCGYDLRGSTGPICPECGNLHAVTEPGQDRSG